MTQLSQTLSSTYLANSLIHVRDTGPRSAFILLLLFKYNHNHLSFCVVLISSELDNNLFINIHKCQFATTAREEMEDRSALSADPMFLKNLKPIGYRLTDPQLSFRIV